MSSSTFGGGIHTEDTGGVAGFGVGNACGELEPSEIKYFGANLNLFLGTTQGGFGGSEVRASGVCRRGTGGSLGECASWKKDVSNSYTADFHASAAPISSVQGTMLQPAGASAGDPWSKSMTGTLDHSEAEVNGLKTLTR